MKFKHGYTLEEIIAAGDERKARFVFAQYRPDISARVYLFKDTPDSRENPVTSGYRPAHQVHAEFATTGEHIYYEDDVVFPGQTAMAYVKFLFGEYHLYRLWPGKEIVFKEGSKVVGKVVVTEIFNELLRGEIPGGQAR